MIVEVDFEVLQGACRWHPLVTKIGDWSTDYDRCKAYEIGKIPGYCTPQTCPLLEGDGVIVKVDFEVMSCRL
jgi:hypothetical protein